MALDQFRPSKIWRTLTPDRRLEAARAFWTDEHAEDQHLEAVLAIADRMKFRARSVVGLTLERRIRYLASLPALPETVASRLLVAYHLDRQRPMMGAFLDALGIAHDGGLITEEGITAPTPERLANAARDLIARHPAEDVRLYFSALIAQDPAAWGGLIEYL
jgi:hypothetical protein